MSKVFYLYPIFFISKLRHLYINQLKCWHCIMFFCFVWFMVFNATFNNILVISWWSVLLVEDPEKITDMSQVTDKLYHIMLYTLPWAGIESTTSVVICTDCIGSCNPTTIRPRCPPIVECMTNNGNIYAIERGFNKHYLLFPR
jgi:hypothetical protein